MAGHTVKLKHGLKLEGKPQLDAELAEPTAGMIRAARKAGERLMQTPDGPMLVPSPSEIRSELLRLQILKIGAIPANPLPEDLFASLSGFDLHLLEQKAIEIDTAALNEVAQRGRDHQDG